MNLADIEMILKIILITLEIAILVKDNFLKPKRHKKTVATSAKISDVKSNILVI